MRQMSLLGISLAGMMLLSGCKMSSPVPTDTFCAVYVPVMVSKGDAFAPQTADTILANNLFWRSNCEKPSR